MCGVVVLLKQPRFPSKQSAAMLLLTKPNSISAPAPKTALHVVARLLQLACTASTTVIFFHLLSAGIKAEVVVLLTFVCSQYRGVETAY